MASKAAPPECAQKVSGMYRGPACFVLFHP